MDTDQLERDMNELCHKWMHGKGPTEGVFGPVQAAARVFIFQALSAWTVLESTGQTEQLAARLPRLAAWSPRRRGAARAAGLQREGLFPEALIAPRHPTTPPRPRARRRSLRSVVLDVGRMRA
jgi:hypothetical protein